MKILIIEDEAPAARRLKKLVEENNTAHEVLGPLDSVESSLNWFEKNPLPDLLLLDIQLSDGLSFELFEQLKLDLPVIFTTAYDEYALRAFQVNSIDYLLKPIDPIALNKALSKVDQMKVIQHEPNWKKMMETLMPKQFKTRFLFKKGDGYKPVLSADIAYFQASEKLVVVQTFDDRQFIMDDTLDALEQQLDPSQFYRANRAFLISEKAVKELRNSFNGKLKLYLHKQTANAEITISRDKASEFKKWLGA